MIRKLFIGFLIYLIGGFPTLVFALPQGGEVISGTVGINTPNANNMAINQGSDQAIVNWQGFDIGQQESVTINQPNRNSVILNRVIGENPSAILGKLSANGKVFLTNPSGILFGQGAQVNVGALVASTLNISNQDFLNRNYRFTQDKNKPLASIINLGDINAGSVGLLAPSVENRGTILASLGSIALASGEKASLDFEGDGLINFEITQPVNGEIRDSDGNVLQSGVVNSGLIQANGGRVVLSALQAQGMIQSVVNNEGMIEAKGVEERDGKIFLLGADEVLNSGTLDVSNNGSGRTGGTIHVFGDKVGVFGNAHLNASGNAGGGTILIGGDFQGKNDAIQNAYRTYVGSDAVITADATNTGNGGKVIVWADDVARFYGAISAKGGAISGDGGFVETSGKNHLEFLGDVDITAANGNFGTLLLDPQDITIADGAGGADDAQVLGDSTALFADGGAVNFTIAEQTLEALTGNIILQATRDITINNLTSDGLLNLSNLTSGESVVFQAGRNITFSNTGNTLSTAGGNIHLEADSPHSSAGAADGTGTLTTGVLNTSGGSVTLIGSAFSISSAINSGSGDINIAKAVNGATLGVGATEITDTILDLITTTGTLKVGQATTAGTDGAGTSATTLSAGVVTVTNVSNTTATSFSIFSGTSVIFATTASSFTGSLTVSSSGTIDVNIDATSDAGVSMTASSSFTVASTVQVIAENDASGAGDLSISAAGITLNGGSGANAENLENEGTGNVSITSSAAIALKDHAIGLLGGALNISAGTNTITKTASSNAQISANGNITITAGGIGTGTAFEDIILETTNTSGNKTLSINLNSGGDAFLTTAGGADDNFNQFDISIASASSEVSMTFKGTSDDTVTFNPSSGQTLTATLNNFDIGLNFALNDSNTTLKVGNITAGDSGVSSEETLQISSNSNLAHVSGSKIIMSTASSALRLVGIKGIGTSTNPFITNNLKSFAATASTGGIFLTNNVGVVDINSTTIGSTVGVVASAGNIVIKNTTGGFTFTDIIKADSGSITLESAFAMADLNGTATSLSAENGSVSLTASSGDIGASGNPIEVSARSISTSVNVSGSASVFVAFTNTTPTATSDPTPTPTPTPDLTPTPDPTPTPTPGPTPMQVPLLNRANLIQFIQDPSANGPSSKGPNGSRPGC
jgi:filamentous hemagglutinin family protein